MSGDLTLRIVTEDDLPVFFAQQWDPEANRMAAFPARDREAFMAHWAKILVNPEVVVRTIVFDGAVAGNILSFAHDGDREVGYWIGKSHYGKGIATRALRTFLEVERTRPLYAHVARHNGASLRVLEKCGFRIVGTEKDFASFEGQAIVGVILVHDSNEGRPR